MSFVNKIKNFFGKNRNFLLNNGSKDLYSNNDYEKLNNEQSKKIYEQLLKKDNDVGNTINFKILQTQYIEVLGIDKIEILSHYPNIQEKIVELSAEQLHIFVKILNYVQKEQDDWISVTEDVIDIVKTEKYKKICNQFEQLSDEDKINFVGIALLRTELVADINLETIEDLHKYNEKITEEAISIINNPKKTESEDEWYYYTYLGIKQPIDKVKNAILELKYGMNIEKAKSILQEYGDGIECFKGTNHYDILLGINNVIEETDIKKLQCMNFTNIIPDYKTLINFESDLDNFIVEDFNEKLYKPNEQDFSGIEKVKIIDCNGKRKKVDVPIYNVIGNSSKEIYMLTHSRGGISGFYDEDRKYNCKEDWFRANLKNDVISTCCVSNEFWGNVSGFYTLGFSELDKNSIYGMAPHDAGSGNEKFGRRDRKDPHFKPKELINNTVGYNEVVIKRLRFQNQQYQKRAPNYIVFYKEIEPERTKSDKKLHREYQKRVKSEWNTAKRAAAEFGVPIVVVDIEKSIKLESKEIANMVKKIEMTFGQDNKLLEDLMFKFENNRSYLLSQNNSENYNEIINRYFSKTTMKNYLNRIIDTIRKGDEQRRNRCLNSLEKVSLVQRKKWEYDTKMNLEKVDENMDDLEKMRYDKYLKQRTIDYVKFFRMLENLKVNGYSGIENNQRNVRIREGKDRGRTI